MRDANGKHGASAQPLFFLLQACAFVVFLCISKSEWGEALKLNEEAYGPRHRHVAECCGPPPREWLESDLRPRDS